MTITIYADSNIYRYVANGELEITTIGSVGSVRFAYSSIHFDEMLRTGNAVMLKGMEALKAVLLVTNENGEYDIDSLGVCLEYVNPFEKFDEYKSNCVAPYDAEESINELLLRFLGADNYEELKNVPQSLVDMAKDVKKYWEIEADDLVNKANETASDLEEFIEKDLSTRRPLSETRKEFGYPKGATSIHDNDKNPIDAIWSRLEPKMSGLTKEQFFGFESIPGVQVERSRIGDVSGCHTILNMIGFHPDKGLPKREDIRRILSDGQHLGYGSLCGGFLTSDHRLYRKAQAIFEYKKYPSQAMHVPYKLEGMSTMLIEPGIINRVKLAPPTQ